MSRAVQTCRVWLPWKAVSACSLEKSMEDTDAGKEAEGI